ncbi:uncharacterized protein LOC115627405 [Scaptodrosophila lebanonensis]|uniref:Uncharacterized protein LOC115627405 n=1 Tax=Drosophila lebanonensis TaxID=7225 RepID=A0A6J2TS74_DROLE|nr:uncharacterized protein LOC115627405 [Scaptodrosophila lebanonensis]
MNSKKSQSQSSTQKRAKIVCARAPLRTTAKPPTNIIASVIIASTSFPMLPPAVCHLSVKLLLLRLLLVTAYEYGYHPSAEEFDSLLRETRTWTRDLLAAERRRERFIPKYRQQTQVQKIDRPAGGSLDFQMFSEEQNVADQQPYVYEDVDYGSEPPGLANMHVQSQLIEISEPNKKLPPAASASNGSSTFPIFFTNPATGIVYAITELGHADNYAVAHLNDSSSIPIFVTKTQYDNDLQAMRDHYEGAAAAAAAAATSSALSTPVIVASTSPTTARPQIIRLQKPKGPTAGPPRPSNKLPMATSSSPHKHKPPPVMVPSNALAVNDQIKRPTTTMRTPTKKPLPTRRTRTKTKKSKKKKKKKQHKRPGYRPTLRPTSVLQQPQIILGTRTSTTTNSTTIPSASRPSATISMDKLSTQLEKPQGPSAINGGVDEPADAMGVSGGGTTFSQHPFVVSSGYIDLNSRQVPKNHRLMRRSVETVSARKTGGGGGGGGKRRRKSQTKKRKQSPETSTISRRSGAAKQKRKEKRSEEDGFDLLDLLTDEADEDGAEYYDDGSYYYDEETDGNITPAKLNVETTEWHSDLKEDTTTQDNSSSAEEGADFGALEEELVVPVSPTGVSSKLGTVQSAEETQSNSKNSMGKKRIRRRPPSVGNQVGGDGSSSDEYDDEDDEDESATGMGMSAGFGSFLRMIFYPVQVAMDRIYDGFTGHSEEEDANKIKKPKYPSYTLYHSAHSKGSNEFVAAAADDDNDDDVDEEEDSSSSLGGWFSSWFGLRRRTKKIGSTTVMPLTPTPAPAPAPTEEPGWLEWLGFGFGKTTTTAASIEEDDYDKWFSSWFDSKPKQKARRRTTTSTTTTTTPTPQVPILTIVDPLRNPQNWIGILAHHIANTTSSSTTTHNPLMEALTRVTTTTTTTENPDIPRRISYEKFQIWRLKPQDEAQVRALEEFKKGEDGNKLQWLKGPSLRGLTDVLVPPKMLVDLQGTLNFEGIAHEVLIFDVGKAISYEQSKEDYLYTTPTHSKRPAKPSKFGPAPTQPAITWNKYYEHDDIINYLETIRMRHAQLVELIHIGRSYEGRPLVVVKIESKQTAAAARAAVANSHKRLKYKRKSGQANAVFIEAGAHGLAWIGPAAATWMISELLRLMRTNKTDPDYESIRNTTWYIMPVLNPDGYVYSHEYDRFWKKSRSRHVAKTQGGILNSAMTWLQQKRNSEKVCYGVDLDRNWLYHWGKRGSSKTPCNEFYAGPTPFSEPETKAVSEFLMDYRTQIKLYISLQAYGQVISYPVKANSTFNAERMDDFLDVAMVGTDCLRKRGSKARYKVDSAHDLIEHRSGCADAFAAYEIGIPFSYTLQLADNGVHGYLLPSSAIEPTARDAFEIITGMLDYI